MRSDMSGTPLMLNLNSIWPRHSPTPNKIFLIWWDNYVGQQGKVGLTGPKEPSQSKSTDIKQKRLWRHSLAPSLARAIKATKKPRPRRLEEFHLVITVRRMKNAHFCAKKTRLVTGQISSYHPKAGTIIGRWQKSGLKPPASDDANYIASKKHAVTPLISS